MKTRLYQWGLALLLAFAGAASAANPVAGEDYVVLPRPQPTENAEGVEVREFFSYACPYCYRFRPLMHDWLAKAPEGVHFVRTPVVFNESWEPFARAYLAAEALDVVDQVHVPLFQAIHDKGQRFRDVDSVADFFASQGIPRDKALSELTGFTVDRKLRQARQQLRNYKVTATPAVVVNGKYLVSPGRGSLDGMIATVDALVRQELAAKGGAAAKAD